MKKKVGLTAILAVFAVLALSLVSCTTSSVSTVDYLPATTVQIEWDRGADYAVKLEFAAGDIRTAVEKCGSKVVESGAEWTVRLGGIDESLGEQAYRLTVEGTVITIIGGDSDGLMYGGLDLSEQIVIKNGIQGVEGAAVTPYIKERGFKYHIPLDLRCPCYPSIGTSGIKNIANVWDMDFWKEFIDTMIRERFNTLFLTNINPFATLVKVEDYPDCAIDDVWAPAIPYDDSYKGSLEDAVRDEHWLEENHVVVKKMSIDEKIAFWQNLMEYGNERGIKFYFRINHIHVFAEHGAYGITDEIDNPVTKDYYTKAATALLQTYPLLKGLDINDGENMGWDNSEEGDRKRWQWLHDVYVPAINAALEADPDRELSMSGGLQFPDIFADLNPKCKRPMNVGFASTHMYATSTPKEPGYLDGKPYKDVYISFRNEDSFDMRFGDYDFFKDFIGCMPADKMGGYLTGSDGYCYQRDYSSADPDLQGQLYLEKHWLNFELLGHLGYNYDLDYDYFLGLLKDHTDQTPYTDLLFETTCLAGRVFPTVSKQYFSGNSDYTWHVSGSWSHPSGGGYLGLKRFMRSTNVYPNGGCISIEDYCLAKAAGEAIDPELVTPVQTAQMLKEYGEKVLANVEKIRAEVKQPKNPTDGQKYFWCLLEDDEALAYLSLYYSEKFLAAVDLRIYNETKDESFHESAVQHAVNSSNYWNQHAAIISRNYVVEHLARLGDFDVNALAKLVEEDIDFARNWKPRNLPRSFNAPAKGDFFNGQGVK